ncbi:hypothetical protein N752_29985 [Desulforamulus aquiferis]|nr:LytTR family DNA-binding domain-containing protein [Desulforamulus aquiferis]RYD01533.1 hypothetical protein N752_29985 [Desulforamulus aquiferis]
MVFLDIELPGIKGSEIGKRLKADTLITQVVFVTGKPDYAVEAFDMEAVDYLIKPFDQSRLNQCINRVESRVTTLPRRYVITTKSNIVSLDIDRIIFVEKVGKVTVFNTLDGEYKSTDTIEYVESMMTPFGFIKSHQSFIINPVYVKFIEKWADRAYQVKFYYGDKMALVSRSRIETLRSILHNIKCNKLLVI